MDRDTIRRLFDPKKVYDKIVIDPKSNSPFARNFFKDNNCYSQIIPAIRELNNGNDKPYYNYYSRYGPPAINQSNSDEFIQKRIKYVKKLFESIRDKGFVEDLWVVDNEAAEERRNEINAAHWHTPIFCIVDKFGLIKLIDGHHRAACLYLLDRPIIARVIHRDKEWEQCRKELVNTRTYHPISHPDIPTNHHIRDDTTRFDVALKHLRSQNINTLVDFGCALGMASRYFAAEGLNVIGIEKNESFIHICKSYEYAASQGIKFYASIEDAGIKGDNYAVYAASVLHHIMNQTGDEKSFIDFIRNLVGDSKVVIAEFPTETCTYFGVSSNLWEIKLSDSKTPHELYNKTFEELGYLNTGTIFVDNRHCNRPTVLWKRK